jgi:uncharacterized lipoprotein YddW (UPF0748 family)
MKRAVPRPDGPLAMERRRPLGRWAALALGALLSACTTVGAPAERLPPRIEPGPPPPDVERGVDLRDVSLRPARVFSEVRALWVVRFSMTSEEAVRDMVERAYAAGINTLIVQVRGRADAFYASGLEPPGESMRAGAGFDPLALTIELAHSRGMAVHAWINTHLVWGPANRPESPEHIVNAHPDWLAVPRPLARELASIDPLDARFVDSLVRYARENPQRVEGVYTSPSHPEVQDRVHAVWLDLATRYDLDGLHFDYIRFPSGDFDYSLGALERFRLWARSVLPADRFAELDRAYASDLFAMVDGEPELWGDFRRHHVTRLVERIHRDVKAVDPRLVVSAAVIADRDLAFADRFQDWSGWLRDGILDIAVPMAYTPDLERFQSLVRVARAEAGHRERVWAGIGAYMNPADRTMRMIDVARTEGAGGIVLFSYDWAVGEGRGDPTDPFLQRIGRSRFGR